MAGRRRVFEVAEEGDRLETLKVLRARLAVEIDIGCAPRDLAALVRQLVAVVDEIDASETGKGDPLDEVAAARNARRTGTTDS